MSLDKFKKLLLPKEEIVGIEITDTYIKVFGFNGDASKAWVDFKVDLPVGTIMGGNLVKPEVLTAVLKKIKSNYFKKRKEKVYAILSLNTTLFYTNILSLPSISSEKELKEAIELNTSLVSPIKLEEAYFDFEDWTQPGDANKKIFITLISKAKINPYLKSFSEDGFELLALEFSLLGLNRLVCNYTEKESKNFLILNFRSEGINIAVGSKEGYLFLPAFESWNDMLEDMGETNISVETLKRYLGLEVPKLISFLNSHYNQSIEGFHILSNNQTFNEQVSQFLISDFAFKPLRLILPPNLVTRNTDDYTVIGSALRGLISRENDTIVSLMPIGTEQKYQETRNYNYISFWTNAVNLTTIFMVIVFAAINFGLFKPTLKNIMGNDLNMDISANQQQEKAILNKEASDFNRNLDLVVSLNQKRYNWQQVLTGLSADPQVIIESIKMINLESDKKITATFRATSREKALTFRDAVKQMDFISNKNVEMPAKLFTEEPDKQSVRFDLVIGLK